MFNVCVMINTLKTDPYYFTARDVSKNLKVSKRVKTRVCSFDIVHVRFRWFFLYIIGIGAVTNIENQPQS